MKNLTTVLAMASLLACASEPESPAQTPVPAPAAAETSTECVPTDDLRFLCGLAAPEDLVPVPNTPWLIAGGMVAGSGLHAIDTAAKTASPLLASGLEAGADPARFPTCPGALDPEQAVLHGLSLRPAANGRYTLYATNHGGRESVEVFELDARDDGLSLV